jgi:hypothetical protein
VAPADVQCQPGGVNPRDPPPGADEVLVLLRQLAVVEAAEEQRRVRQVLQRLRPAVQVGLEELEADPVARHRVLRELEHVLAHQVEELAGVHQVGALRLDHRAWIGWIGVTVVVCDRSRGPWPGVDGHG